MYRIIPEENVDDSTPWQLRDNWPQTSNPISCLNWKNVIEEMYAASCMCMWRKDNNFRQRRLSIHHLLCIVHYISCIILMHQALVSWIKKSPPPKKNGIKNNMPMPESHTAPALSRLCGIFFVCANIVDQTRKDFLSYLYAMVGSLVLSFCEGGHISLDIFCSSFPPSKNFEIKLTNLLGIDINCCSDNICWNNWSSKSCLNNH